MITNDRQYRITKSQFRRLREAIDLFEVEAVLERVEPEVLATAELEALKSECDVLSGEIEEYEALKAGTVASLRAEALEELPLILIKARIVRGMSQRQLAEEIGVKEQQIQRYEAERYSSANLSRLAEVARALRLDVSEVAELRGNEDDSGESCSLRAVSTEFPISEMYRRGWFGDFSGSLSAALAIGDELAFNYARQAMPHRRVAYLRQRTRFGSTLNRSSLLAWQCRILLLARDEETVEDFSRDQLTADWFTSLREESRHEDGPRRAKEFLSESGIALVIEPHLSNTYLDGAAFLLPEGRPVVGMTLRYDRLDNFWFVLFHELVHIRDHLEKGKLEDVFDDLESEGDELEQETDRLAGNLLVPDDIWESALARFVRSEESVRKLAFKLAINPAVIAGKIRNEAENYMILRNLVGQGEVRRLFPDVSFAG